MKSRPSFTLSALKTSEKWLAAALADEPEDYDNRALKSALAKVRRAIKQCQTPTRVIVEVEGGNVSAVHSTDATLNVEVLDRDNQDVTSPEEEPEEAAEFTRLEKDADHMHTVY